MKEQLVARLNLPFRIPAWYRMQRSGIKNSYNILFNHMTRKWKHRVYKLITKGQTKNKVFLLWINKSQFGPVHNRIQTCPEVKTRHSQYPRGQDWALSVSQWSRLGTYGIPVVKTGHLQYPSGQDWALSVSQWSRLGTYSIPVVKTGHLQYPSGQDWALSVSSDQDWVLSVFHWSRLGSLSVPMVKTRFSQYLNGQDWALTVSQWSRLVFMWDSREALNVQA